MDDEGQRHSFETLASVTLPPLPKQTLNPLLNQGVALPPLPTRPGTAVRLRAPTPPPRPESTFATPPRGGGGGGSGVSDGGHHLLHHHHLHHHHHPTQLFSSLPGSLRSSSASSSSTDGHHHQQPASSPAPPPTLLLLPDQNITLTNPRTIRQQNVYVDTPIKGSNSIAANSPLHPGCEPPLSSSTTAAILTSGGGVTALSAAVKRPPPPRPAVVGIKHKSTTTTTTSSSPTVITQPLPACKKTGGGSTTTTGISAVIPASLPPSTTISSSSSPPPTDSIICGACGRCRCRACRSARPLPSAWICDNTVLCSADSVLDKLTCMCCVRAGLYHCGDKLTKDAADTREQAWVDSPCSCSSNKRCLRWSCLCLLSIPLPCLLLYPVLKGMTKLAEKCYQSATTQGCRCRDDAADPCSSSSLSTSVVVSTAGSPTDSQKRLLS